MSVKNFTNIQQIRRAFKDDGKVYLTSNSPQNLCNIFTECCPGLWSPSVPDNQCRVFVLWSAAVSRGTGHTGHHKYLARPPSSDAGDHPLAWSHKCASGDRSGLLSRTSELKKNIKMKYRRIFHHPYFPPVPVFVTRGILLRYLLPDEYRRLSRGCLSMPQ